MRRYTICARHHTALHFTTTYCNTHIHNALQHTKHPCNMNKTPRGTTSHCNIPQYAHTRRTATHYTPRLHVPNTIWHYITTRHILQHTCTQRTAHSKIQHTPRKMRSLKNAATLHMTLIRQHTTQPTHPRRLSPGVCGDTHTCRTLQYTATHCNTLQHTATHCAPRKIKSWSMRRYSCMQDTATHCNTLQHTTHQGRSSLGECGDTQHD